VERCGKCSTQNNDRLDPGDPGQTKPGNREQILMVSRRKFIQLFGAASLTAPWAFKLVAENRPSLPRRPIPGTDESLPIMGFGNSQAFRSGNLDLSRQLLNILIAHGGSYIDAGGSSFGLLAQLMQEQNLQDDLFLAPYANTLAWEELRPEVRGLVAKNGKSKPLDLLLSARLEEYSAHSGNFQGLKDEGLVRYVGVARHRQSYHQEMMNLMEAGAVDFVQVNYSILEPEAEERLLPLAQDTGVAILINRPFMNGEYFKRVKGRELPTWVSEFDCHSWAQFSLKFIVSHPAVTCVLTETAKPHHAVDNMGGGMGRLPDQKMRERMREYLLQLT
jgi:diketogulonate reductase-like aldo/keto reductase